MKSRLFSTRVQKLLPFLLGSFALGNVVGDNKRCGVSRVFHLVQEHLHVDHRFIFPAMVPLAGELLPRIGVLKGRQQFWSFLGGMEIAGAHLQEVHSVIPVLAKRRFIDLENLQGLPFEDPHGQRIVRKEKERIGFALAERMHHEVAGVAKDSLLQGARDGNREAGHVFLKNIIRDALLDALDGHFLA